MALSNQELQEANNFRLGAFIVGGLMATVGAYGLVGGWGALGMAGFLIAMGALFEKAE